MRILAEDKRHQSFVRQYLKQNGFDNHDISLAPLPSGRGSGEQWVRQRYSLEMKAFRARALGAKAQTALVVIIDADTSTIDYRLTQLRSALNAENIPDRRPEESVAHLIPKRHIETWILCLTGEAVNEERSYRENRDIDGRVKPATLSSRSLSTEQHPDSCVDSLRLAILEIRERLSDKWKR
ncbi:MAG: hypothetical protein U0Q16_07365 [Bryobacteraceae bacterium]